MTVAGIGSILICMNRLDLRSKTRVRWSRKVLSALKKGYRWLKRHWCVNPRVDVGYYYYYMYGLERVGTLSKKKFIGKHDWYKEGARELLKLQGKDGGWKGVISTSFALLFLRRATRGLVETKGGESKRPPKGIPTR
jgi:hypothetical protein